MHWCLYSNTIYAFKQNKKYIINRWSLFTFIFMNNINSRYFIAETEFTLCIIDERKNQKIAPSCDSYLPCILYIVFYAFYSIHCFPCIAFYALYFMYCILWIFCLSFIQSIVFCALYSMHCILCIVFCKAFL